MIAGPGSKTVTVTGDPRIRVRPRPVSLIDGYYFHAPNRVHALPARSGGTPSRDIYVHRKGHPRPDARMYVRTYAPPNKFHTCTSTHIIASPIQPTSRISIHTYIHSAPKTLRPPRTPLACFREVDSAHRVRTRSVTKSVVRFSYLS